MAPRRRMRPPRANPSAPPHPYADELPGETPAAAASVQGVATPVPESELVELDQQGGPRVAIVIESASERNAMTDACAELTQRGIEFEETVISAWRDPDHARDYARGARRRGIKVLIAAAGMSAALPGVLAAHTDLPVIGVPLKCENSVNGGLDALLAIAQAPTGTPVACVAVGGARNAAILAAQILYA